MPVLFQSLSQEVKVDFFVKCQELMLKYHPVSNFIIRENTLGAALDAFQQNVENYKGYIHFDDNICILWNKIFVSDFTNVNLVVTENAYKEPNLNFNSVSIDFSVFRQMQDCLKFIKENYTPEIKYILFIREGTPKLYEADKLIGHLK